MSQTNEFQVPPKSQIRVVDELIESSRSTPNFYLMLVLSSVVVTLGLILNNAAVIIGGMLITPLLTPMLTLALGIVISDQKLIWRSAKIIVKAIGVVLLVALLIAIFFPAASLSGEIASRLENSIPYFLIAFTAGLAATFAWAKKDLSAMLPGVAIAVSLLPPLSVFSIGLAHLSGEVMRGSLLVFFLNLLGVILGGVIIFSLLNFYRSKKEAEKEVSREEQEERKKG